MSGKINFQDLPPEVRSLVGPEQRKKKQQTSIEVIRREAIKALASINVLSTKDRERALTLALKMNRTA